MKLICSLLAEVLILERAAESPGGLVETFPAGPSEFLIQEAWMGPRLCISNNSQAELLLLIQEPPL